MTAATPFPGPMSVYESKRWAELQLHWEKKARHRELLRPKARAAIEAAGRKGKDAAARTGQAIADATPEKVKDIATGAVDSALVPTVKAAVHVLELLTAWVVELSDPETVLRHHRAHGHDVTSVDDLRNLDLKQLDDFTRGTVLRWRTFGAGEGAGMGALAMVPVPGVAAAAAITLDLVAMQVLSTAIATRVCHAYGFDATDPDMRHMIDRMVVRAYRNQAPKAKAVKSAGAAFDAAKNRVNWSKKLRDDHRLMAAVEKFMKQFSDGKVVPVKNARMGLPVIAVFVGAGTNAYVLGDVAKQARNYAATLHLAEKYNLELPPNLQQDLDADEQDAEGLSDGPPTA